MSGDVGLSALSGRPAGEALQPLLLDVDESVIARLAMLSLSRQAVSLEHLYVSVVDAGAHSRLIEIRLPVDESGDLLRAATLAKAVSDDLSTIGWAISVRLAFHSAPLMPSTAAA